MKEIVASCKLQVACLWLEDRINIRDPLQGGVGVGLRAFQVAGFKF